MPFTWIRSRIIVSRPKCNVLKTQEHSQSWESGGSGVNFFRLLCSDYRVNGEAIKKINLSSVVFVCNLYTSFLFPTMGMQYYNWAQVSCCFFFCKLQVFLFFPDFICWILLSKYMFVLDDTNGIHPFMECAWFWVACI